MPFAPRRARAAEVEAPAPPEPAARGVEALAVARPAQVQGAQVQVVSMQDGPRGVMAAPRTAAARQAPGGAGRGARDCQPRQDVFVAGGGSGTVLPRHAASPGTAAAGWPCPASRNIPAGRHQTPLGLSLFPAVPGVGLSLGSWRCQRVRPHAQHRSRATARELRQAALLVQVGQAAPVPAAAPWLRGRRAHSQPVRVLQQILSREKGAEQARSPPGALQGTTALDAVRPTSPGLQVPMAAALPP